jgi:hydroxyacylglutathione hydrolase
MLVFDGELIEVFRVPSGPFHTNSYVLACKSTKRAFIIDASPGSYEKIVALLEQKNLTATLLFLTHSHWDHIADAHLFAKNEQLPIAVHIDDMENARNPGSDGIPSPVLIQRVEPSVSLEEGLELSLGSTTWRVIHTPGHSPGCVCLYCPEEKVLFSGDTLFRNSYGSLQLPTSQPERMRPSLKKLAALGSDTVVFPGHGSSTTIGDELVLLRGV